MVLSPVTEIGIDGILRGAWKTVRLDALRVLVRRTIGDLEGLPTAQLLGRQPSRSEVETGSVRAALDACCDELREGCGLPTSPELSVQVQSMRAADADWTGGFSNALEAYRRAACKGLDASLTESRKDLHEQGSEENRYEEQAKAHAKREEGKED